MTSCFAKRNMMFASLNIKENINNENNLLSTKQACQNMVMSHNYNTGNVSIPSASVYEVKWLKVVFYSFCSVRQMS